MTWKDLITSSLRAIGQVGPGRTPSNSEFTTAQFVLNAMLDNWSIDRRAVFTIRSDVKALTAGKQAYTIGGATADFNLPRPVNIESANLIFTDVTPNIRRPLDLIDDSEYARIRVQPINDSVPMKLYYDGGFVGSTVGLATIFLWPGPASNWSLEMYSWQQFSQVPDITVTFFMPPGYAEAIRYSLAVRLGEEWGRPARPAVIDLANSSRAAIDQLNSQISTPSGKVLDTPAPAVDGK